MLHRRLFPAALAVLSLFAARDASPDAPPPQASGPALVTPPDGRVAEIEALVQTLVANLKDAQIAVAVLDVDTGRYLAVHNEHLPLNPASNAKLYTAGAALALLHGDHRYETSLNGTLKDTSVGSVVLRGHGDPSLATEDLFGMVQEMRAHGIRKIDGDILVDQRFHDEQTNPPAYDQQPNEWAAFRAPVSAVALNENTVTLNVRPTSADQNANAWFDPPGFVDVDGSVKTGDEGADNVILALSPNGHRLSAKLSGTVGGGSKLVRYTRRVDDPTLLAGYALKAVLDKLDVKLTGDVKAGHLKAQDTLARHESAPLSQLLYPVGKSSDNFYAEMIFKSLGGELKSRPAKHSEAAQLVTKWVEKIGAMDAGVTIKNGSGLFDANRTTTASVVQLLRACYKDPSIEPEYVAQLAIGGVDGTLAKRFKEHKNERSIRAKTGTLDDVVALSGYVFGPGKSPIAFSILVNKTIPGNARGPMDRFVDKLADRQNGR
jgi:D-alanyl-D-alanine carboxypeptidase/D-alanyl-D-alanine-endopeptidase (penicillin-binding protein 4)